jgi:hypothetical protein
VAAAAHLKSASESRHTPFYCMLQHVLASSYLQRRLRAVRGMMLRKHTL